MKIIAAHLFNDYSGSPKVLMQLIKGWARNGIPCTLYTCSKREGFLSDLTNVNYSYFEYSYKKNPWLRLLNLIWSQIILALKISQNSSKTDIIYVNTILPFGAAIAGKIKGQRVIYHIHESSIRPKLLKIFLLSIVKWCATDVIYVSNYLANAEPIADKKKHVIHNALEQTYLNKAVLNRSSKQNLKNVLMVCSLKKYKGLNEFVTLAQTLKYHNFKLVINANTKSIATFFNGISLPNNLTIYATQTDLHPHYKWADLVLNLSHTDQWVETFGLTLIEGMAYGAPAIAPPIGGVKEVVFDGENGFTISSKNITLIANKIILLTQNNTAFKALSLKALETANSFSEEKLIEQNLNLILNH